MMPDPDQARGKDPQRLHLERRSQARRKRMLRDHPVTGHFMLAMSDEPTAATAFDSGAPWERWVAELVRGSFPDGIFLFHRSRGGDRPGDIDIIAVLPTGIWTVDIQRFDGATADIRAGTGTDGRRERLSIGGDDCTELLDDLEQQANAVSAALGQAGFAPMSVQSVLCLVDVDPGWRGPQTVGVTHVTKARPMLTLLGNGPVVLDGTDIASLGLALGRQLNRQYSVN